VPDRLLDLALSERGFVFDPVTGQTWSANDTGKFVLERLRAGDAPSAAAAALREAFAVGEADDPERDVRELVLLLRQQGLLGPEEAAW
jgi:hypothetical protein